MRRQRRAHPTAEAMASVNYQTRTGEDSFSSGGTVDYPVLLHGRSVSGRVVFRQHRFRSEPDVATQRHREHRLSLLAAVCIFVAAGRRQSCRPTCAADPSRLWRSATDHRADCRRRNRDVSRVAAVDAERDCSAAARNGWWTTSVYLTPLAMAAAIRTRYRGMARFVWGTRSRTRTTPAFEAVRAKATIHATNL